MRKALGVRVLEEVIFETLMNEMENQAKKKDIFGLKDVVAADSGCDEDD